VLFNRFAGGADEMATFIKALTPTIRVCEKCGQILSTDSSDQLCSSCRGSGSAGEAG